MELARLRVVVRRKVGRRVISDFEADRMIEGMPPAMREFELRALVNGGGVELRKRPSGLIVPSWVR